MKVDYTHIVSHQSSREGGRIKIAVLHTTEGDDHPTGTPPEDLVGLGSLFDTEEASANYGVNVGGKIAQYVEDARKAWAVCNYNSFAINLEQIGFAAFSKQDWFKRHAQLHGTATWLQYVHDKHGIPLRPGAVSNGNVIRTGIVQHKDLGAIGCGHTDCGPGYPQGYVTMLAQYFVARAHNPNGPRAKRLERRLNHVRKRFGVPLLG